MSAAFDGLSRPLSLNDPRLALRAFASLPHAFLLYSGATGVEPRWSFFGADPFLVYRGGDAFARARWRERAASVAARGEAPFAGGVVGYWAYDYGRRLEQLPSRSADDLGLPDAVFGLYDVTGAFDHATGRAWLFSSGLPEEGSARRARARTRLDAFAEWIERARPESPRAAAVAAAPVSTRCTFTSDGYRRGVEAVKWHIARGDIFQANLSQRWSVPLAALGAAPGDHAVRSVAPALFEALARRSPAPYAAYFDAGDHAIVSASPERFLELHGGRVETKPIKGTRPRSNDPLEDARLAVELLASPKDRAENVMIVDVLRNDLGRVCVTGSVETPVLCALERYPQVHHLVSTVTGALRSGVDPFDLLHACFPGGSITGAPKIRAMEILDALEPVRRHIYTGSVGWIGWNGDADWNIAIRSALVTRDAVHFAAGGGITADSDPDTEYEETLHKAEGMRLALSELAGAEVRVGEAVRARHRAAGVPTG